MSDKLEKNIVDLRLKLDGSADSKDILVVTEMDADELVAKAEEIMEEAEREGYENNEMIFFHEHADALEEKLDIEIVNPEKRQAMRPNPELEDLKGDSSE